MAGRRLELVVARDFDHGLIKESFLLSDSERGMEGRWPGSHVGEGG